MKNSLAILFTLLSSTCFAQDINIIPIDTVIQKDTVNHFLIQFGCCRRISTIYVVDGIPVRSKEYNDSLTREEKKRFMTVNIGTPAYLENNYDDEQKIIPYQDPRHISQYTICNLNLQEIYPPLK